MKEIKGLPIKQHWLDLILSKKKTWEIRGSNTHYRGTIALIKSGSKTIVGIASIKKVIGPLTKTQLLKAPSKHRIPAKVIAEYGLPYTNTFAWVLSKIIKLKTPIPYNHPYGAIVWIKLSSSVVEKINRELELVSK